MPNNTLKYNQKFFHKIEKQMDHGCQFLIKYIQYIAVTNKKKTSFLKTISSFYILKLYCFIKFF